jgi:membrane protein implicated in regulation of membrane protease activity
VAALINSNVAYLLTVTAVMLFIMTAVAPKSSLLKAGFTVCLGAAGYEFSQLGGDPWALLVVALSPLPFFVAIRQPRSQPFLAIVTILMLTLGSVFIFWDADGQSYRLPLAGFASIICGRIIWILFLRIRDTRSTRLSDNPDSLVGLIGTARSEIEKYETGSVEIEGELWVARSDQPIPAGSMVRIVRFDGLVLTVEKVEKLTR